MAYLVLTGDIQTIMNNLNNLEKEGYVLKSLVPSGYLNTYIGIAHRPEPKKEGVQKLPWWKRWFSRN